MTAAAPLRGVVEGYYGRPWSGAARRDVIAFLGARGMTAFVYGPKHDPWHRARWREPYPADVLADLADTARAAADAGVRLVWAVSPGLDLRFADAADRAALRAKVTQVTDAGIDAVALFLDDVPEALVDPADVAAFGGHDAAAIARAHASVANELHAFLRARGRGGLAFLVPTDYAGTAPSPYLAALGPALAAEVPIGWTGPAVLSPCITAADARARRAHTGGHGVVLWDNYPVNDVVLRNSLHLGPLTGRDAALGAELAGHLFNPMTQPYASLVALATAADWCRDPATYDPHASWRRALDALEPAGHLAVLAEQTCSSTLSAPAWDDAHALRAALDALRAAWPTPVWPDALDALEAEYRRQATAAACLPAALGAHPLADEIAPWTAELARNAADGLAATALLRALRPDVVDLAVVPDGDARRVQGRVRACDAEAVARLRPRFAAPPPAPDLGAYLGALGDFLSADIGLPAELGLNVHGKALYVVPRSLADVEIVTGHNVHHDVLALVAELAAAHDPRAASARPTLAVDDEPVPLDADGRFDLRVRPGATLTVVDRGGPTTARCAR